MKQDRFIGEVPEAAATGEVARIYAEMRDGYGVATVPTIYRHLATEQGRLAWVWSSIRAPVLSGEIPAAAKHVVDGLALEPLPPMRRTVLLAMAVTAEAEAQIRNVLQVFNRINPINLVAAASVCAALGHETSDMAATAHRATDPWVPTPLGPLPPILDVGAMPEPLADLVLELSMSGEAGETRFVPSLYRHLAHWPNFLALAATLLLPRYERGDIGDAAAVLAERVKDESRVLARALTMPDGGPVGVDERRHLATVLRRFVGKIPELIVVGELLQGALPT